MISARDLIQKVTGARRDGILQQEDKVRLAMLQLLQADGGSAERKVEERIRFAADMEALWYLREDVLQAIRPPGGELAARRELVPIDRMFKGWLPGTMKPRNRRV